MKEVQLPINKEALPSLINELNRLEGFVIAHNKTDLTVPFPMISAVKEKLEDIVKNEFKKK